MTRRAFFLGFMFCLAACASEPGSPLVTVQEFYTDYLEDRDTDPMPFSKAFLADQAENKKSCKRNAGSDICGWAASGDPYLDTQETDPELTYENSGISYLLSAPGEVTVTLNVYPSDTAHAEQNQRSIVYKMILEDGIWVVDDLRSGQQGWARETMQQENAHYRANPNR